MEFVSRPFVWCIAGLIPAILYFLVLFRRKNPSSNRRLPLGPPGWPVFGNMPHKTIAGLKQIYGPVLWLKIGAINTMVVQSVAAAEEFFKKHDNNFLDRNITEAMRAHDYNTGSIALALYDHYWRVMKRVMTMEMLVNKKINETSHVRDRCVDTMLSWIAAEAGNGSSPAGIHVARFVFLASFNMIGNLMLSRDLADPASEVGAEFFAAMVSLMEWVGHPNMVDLFPILRQIDPQGIRRKTERDMGKVIEIVSEYVQERIEERRRGSRRMRDYLEVLLDYEGDESDFRISNHDLNIIAVEIFMAGTESSSGTIEWVMVELLNNPTVMFKVKAEMSEVVGLTRKMEESDIDNMGYLQAVVKETLRMHPPIPFLVPRRGTQETVFMGYDVPENTQVLVNAYAIGRDPYCYEDPDVFRPERFLGTGVDFKGNDFGLIPFGEGKRICAGIPLAKRMLQLVLGSLVHEFEWTVHISMADKVRDTRERMGIVVRKIEPLVAIPTRHK